jgi:hypothetical protein
VRYRSFVADSARWERWQPRPGDIVISTSPKCGTTWTQMICALLVFQTPDLPAPLTAISPWLDIQTADLDELLADLDAQEHRRFIKAHVPLDGLPFHREVTYIGVGRDPRDVSLSWENHMAIMDLNAFIEARAGSVGLDDAAEFFDEIPPPPAEDPVERFWQWVDTDPPIERMQSSLRAVLHHVDTFWQRRHEPNVVLLHYADLQADLEGEMRRLAARLGIEVDEARWPVLVKAATFGEMKQRARELAPQVTQGFWQDPDRFFNRGESGQWRELIGDVDLDRYHARVAALVDPELAAWVHR